MTQQVLSGKIGLVFGVANKRSIAWAIAKAWAAAGARLIFNYQGERLKENVEELVGEFGEKTPLFPCDVSSDDEIKAFFESVRSETDRVDLMLHSLAFAPREALEGDFVSTTREAFRVAHDISAYSLVALAREAAPLMTNGGSIVAMTYYGAEKVVPHYNVMGVAKASLEASTRYLAYDLGPKKIRVNCISAGPVQTLAARGISGFTSMLKHYQERAPLKRSCDPAELGATGVFLASDARRSHHRPGHLRRWRLPNNGHVNVAPAVAPYHSARSDNMIARIWHGWTKRADAKVYEEMLRNEIFPSIAARNIEGYHGAELFIREDGDEVEFVTLLRFDSMDAVKEFAGVRRQQACDFSESRSAHHTNGAGAALSNRDRK